MTGAFLAAGQGVGHHLEGGSHVGVDAPSRRGGLIDGDLAGFPNGRRVSDNVVAIELRAIAGALFPLVDPSFTPDAASGLLYDLVKGGKDANTPPPSVSYLTEFPYLDHPVSGYQVVPLSASA